MSHTDDGFIDILNIGITSSISLGVALTLFIIIHDYILLTLNDVANSLIGAGISGNWISSVINGFINNITAWIPALDYLWLASFIVTISGVFMASYRAKREGYFSLFGKLSFGVMILLFIATLFENFTSYIYNVFFNVILVNVSDSLVFFSFYIKNFVIINFIILIIAIALNFIDFGFSDFFNRKVREQDGGTQEREL